MAKGKTTRKTNDGSYNIKQKIKLNCTNPFKYGVSSDTLDGKAVPAPLEIPHRFTHVKCLEMSNVRGNKDDNGHNGTYLWESVTQFSSDDHLNTFEVMISTLDSFQ